MKKAIIFVHGLFTSGDCWDKVVSFNSLKTFKKYKLNLPWSKDISCAKETCSFDNLVNLLSKFVNEILIKEKLKKIILVGHSLGANVSLAYAGRNPNKVEKLILYAPFLRKNQLTRVIRLYGSLPDNIASLGKYLGARGGAILFETIFGKAFRDINKIPNIDKYMEMAKNSDTTRMRHSISTSITAVRRQDFRKLLRRVSLKVPTCLIYGKYDAIVKPYKNLKEFPNVFSVLVDSAHAMIAEDAEGFAKIIKRFIS